jgi:hypothetical protein
MKSPRFLLMLLWATSLLLLTSCGGREEKTETNTTATDTTVATTSETPTQPTMDTTPLHMMVATHRVKNFNQWKASYDAHDSLRLANGMHNYVIGRSLQDSNNVLVAVTVDDMDKAKSFARGPSLKQAMQRGGVTGTPSFKFITFRHRNTGTVDTDIRSMATFTVRDWDAWKRSFESGRQIRMDHGLIDRGYGHDPDNNRKVTVVMGVTDTARARTFWNSDTLKQIRARSGVVGSTERFVYQVVQRYQ